MRNSGRQLAAGLVEWMLVLMGVACLSTYGWMSYRIAQLERESRSAVARMLAEREKERAAPEKVPEPVEPSPEAIPAPDDGLIGELDIPRLHLSAAVMTGDDRHVLAGAVGYLPDTALPWTAGNTALAAHRDRLFRPLQGIRYGDEIRLSTRHGDFTYHVVRTFVVGPEDVWVLNATPNVDLTLITCYPFVYVGHAPHRFIVRAQKVTE